MSALALRHTRAARAHSLFRDRGSVTHGRDVADERSRVCGVRERCFEELAVGLIAQSLGLPAHAVQPCVRATSSEQWVHKGVCGDGHVFAGEAGVSKIRFKLPQPTTTEGWAAQHTALAQLPCTQGLLAPFVFASGVSLSDEGLAQASQAVRDAPWGAALHTWHYCRPNPPPYTGSLAASTAKGLTFRASAVRDGKHSFSSPQLAQAVGAAVHETHGLGVNLRKFDLEVIAIMLQGELVVGLNFRRGKRHSNGRLGGEPAPRSHTSIAQRACAHRRRG